MRIVIPGGSGHLGRLLVRHFAARGDEVVVLSRGGRSDASPGAARVVPWDATPRHLRAARGSSGHRLASRYASSPSVGGLRPRWDAGAHGGPPGAWASEIDGADAVVNLAGRSVDCRYHARNLAEMWASRVDSTRAVGEAIAAAARPPRVWLQSSTATIYAHRFDAPNDEATGVIGGHEPDAPAYWRLSIEIAAAWERALADAETPRTRKVALRTAMVMSAEPGTVFAILLRHVRSGFGGAFGDGRQWMSWVHERDFVRAVAWLIDRDDVAGPVNVTAPEPMPQREFLRALRDVGGAPFGLPVARWMLEIGTFLLRTDAELVLKSRRVVPGRLLDLGFAFEFPAWPEAARDLVARRRRRTTNSPRGCVESCAGLGVP